MVVMMEVSWIVWVDCLVCVKRERKSFKSGGESILSRCWQRTVGRIAVFVRVSQLALVFRLQYTYVALMAFVHTGERPFECLPNLRR